MKRLSYNTFILLANNILSATLAFALTVIISRGLGDASFGRYATIMAWILPFTMLADGGLNTLITRNVAQTPDSAAYLLHMLLPIRLFISLTIVAVTWIVAPLLSDDTLIVSGVRIGIWLAVIDAFFGSYTAIFRAWEIVWPILLLNTLFFSLQIISAFWVIYSNADVVTLVYFIVLADFIQLFLTWLLWRLKMRYIYPSSTQATQQVWHILLRQAYPFAIAGLLAMLNMRVMIFLLEHQLPAEVIGWYAVAFRLVEAARLAPNAFFVALFPRLSALIKYPASFRHVTYRAIFFISSYSILVGIITSVTSGWVIPFVFGLEFQPSVRVLNMLIWVLLPSNGRALLTLQLYAYNRQQWVNAILLMGLLVQLIVGYSLVQWYGLYGAPIAVIISEIVLVLCLGWALQHTAAQYQNMKKLMRR
ncbi:MAG: hypothetical protein CUN55_13500 [Phototrophicales bacterium]|nr:MAG: hypothetical protein CUN55_13500 [Phototrophicales bacterium]